MVFGNSNKKPPTREEGNFTVEACIIVPTIILSILALIMIGEFLYQKSCIQSITDQAAQRGAEIWNSPSKDMIYAQITKESMGDVSLYWRLWGMDFAKEKKKSKIREYVDYMIFNSSVFGEPVNIETTADIVEDYIFYKKIRVSTTVEYKNPFSSFLKPFGIRDTISIKAHSDAVVNEPVEFIRTTDFASDTVVEIDNKFFDGKGGKIAEKVKEGFGKIFSTIKDFTKGDS